MTTEARTLKIIPFAIISGLVFFSNALAIETTNPTNEYDSMYRYSALENKTSFTNTTNNENDLVKKIPESNKLLGDAVKELQDIIEKQNSSIEKREDIINASKNRSGLKTFLMGNNLGTLRFQLVQIKDEATLLETLALKSQYSAYLLQIDSQFKLLKEEQIKVEDLLREQKDEFSLFGWFVRML